LTATGPAVGFGSSAGDRDGDGKGSLRSDYDVNAAKKISISGNNFEALIMAVKYEGGSHGVLPKTATRWSRASA